jgi:hypothetical protein
MGQSTTIHDVGAAYDRGEIVRTHALRPTWHFLAPDELRWIQALTGERVQRLNGTLQRRLGVTDGDFRRAMDVLREAMSGGRALTRDEIRAALLAAGFDLAEPFKTMLLGMHAELEAVIVNGPRRGRQVTFMLVDDRIPPTPQRPRDDMLRDLTVRYFTSHGPALARDMAWWSGLTVTDVRHGIDLAGDALEGRTVDEKGYVAVRGGFEPAEVSEPFVRLLSNYDEYLGSYTDYSPIFDPSLPKARTVADVLGAHLVIRDGLVVGGWRRGLTEKRATVAATLLLPLNRAEHVALEAEAESFGRFHGLPVELRLIQP